MPDPEKNGYAVPAVDAMLDIVEHLAKTDHACGVSELSRDLGVSTNLAFRIMKRLVERGYAKADASSAYRLGAGFLCLGLRLQNQFDLQQNARSHLELLAAQTSETAQLQIPDGDSMLVLDAVTPRADYYLQIVPGTRLLHHGNAFGKAVLAFLSPDVWPDVKNRPLPALTRRTITSLGKLEDELALVRVYGLAYDWQEYADGIYCIGAPVFDAQGQPVAGVGVTGLFSRFDPGWRKEAERQVLDCARAISRDIGYDGSRYAGWRQAEAGQA